MHLPSPDHTIVTFAGSDALTFLQSQLTNDVAAIAVGGWQWQGYCSAKGRLQATFALARTGDDAFAAVVHHSVPKPLASIDLGHGRWITIAPPEAAPDEASTDADYTFMRRWNLLGIEALQPEVTAATAEMFVPQMVNWDHVQPGGGVSFSKGCYPGQEVVARAHYRGAVKRQLERQILADDTNAANGREVTLEDGRIADVCNAALREQGGTIALVVAAPAAAQ